MATLLASLALLILVVGTLAGWAVREGHRRARAFAESSDERWIP